MPRIDTTDFTHEYVANNVDAVCIDTSTYMRHEFGFTGDVLKRLSLLKNAHITLLMVDLIEREIVAHLSDKSNESATKLRRMLRSACNLGLVDNEAVKRLAFADFDSAVHAREKIDAFIEAASVETLKASEYCDVERLLADYFELRPPFAQKKKSEFPDAFCLGALEHWARSAGKRVLVISEDEDWRSFAAASDHMICGPSLTDMLAALPPGDEVMVARAGRAAAGFEFAAIRHALERELRGLPVEASAQAAHYVEVDVYDAGLASLPIPRPDGQDFELFAQAPHELVVRWRPQVGLWLEAGAQFQLYDRLDRDIVSLPAMGIKRDFDTEVEVLLSFEVVDDGGVQTLTFSAASLVDDEVHVDLGDLELDLSGDGN